MLYLTLSTYIKYSIYFTRQGEILYNHTHSYNFSTGQTRSIHYILGCFHTYSICVLTICKMYLSALRMSGVQHYTHKHTHTHTHTHTHILSHTHTLLCISAQDTCNVILKVHLMGIKIKKEGSIPFHGPHAWSQFLPLATTLQCINCEHPRSHEMELSLKEN